MTTITINPLDPDQFYAQNVTWVTQSSKILESTDATSLHLDIGRRAMDARRALFALTKNGRDLTNSEREQRKELHHTMQVCVPAFRRSLALQRNLHAGNHKATRKAAARLAAFLLAMVAQSSLFPKNANLDSFSEQHDVTLPRGLGRTHRSVALTLLRDHAHLFAPCPAWVEPVVVCPTHITAQTASYERHRRDENLRRIALRDKIIDLGVLTADEEQLLMRML